MKRKLQVGLDGIVCHGGNECLPGGGCELE